MTDKTLTVQYSGRDQDSAGDYWLKLSQDNFDDDKSADLNDLYQMLGLAKMGISSKSYIDSKCSHVTMTNGVMSVNLNVYVNVPFIGFPYSLSTSNGELSSGSVVEEDSSFDLIFDHSDKENFEGEFLGIVEPEMPFFNASGAVVEPVVTVSERSISVSEPITTVFRCSGVIPRYKHSILLTLTNTPVKILSSTGEDTGETSPGYAIGNLATKITADWVDGSGEAQKTEMDLDIPSCIEDLLETCVEKGEDGEDKVTPPINDTGYEPSYLVYYSACNGNVLKEFWEKK